MSELHPDVAALAPLLGTWSGDGAGEYPTIAPFGYWEEITLSHVGKPFLAYRQRTTARDDGRPLHAETGYIRMPGPGRIELVIAHPTGVAEVAEGAIQIDGARITINVATTTIGRTASAKEVTALRRTLRIDGDTLDYDVDMAAVGLPLQHHLAAHLTRQSTRAD
jgi:hypothetical protein